VSYFRVIHGIAALRIPALPPVAWSANCYPESSSCQDWGLGCVFRGDRQTASQPRSLSWRRLRSFGPLSVTQVGTSFKHYRTDTCPTDNYAGPSHAATSSPADALFSHVAVREERGMRPAGFGLSTISSTTRTATTCCSSNTSTQPHKLSKVEIHASLRLLLIL
jgi:hypothetical protein